VRTKLCLAAAAAFLLMAACEDNPFIVGSFGVQGGWAGFARAAVSEADSLRFDFELELSQDRENISGSATVSTPTAEFPLDVRGTWSGSSSSRIDVTLVMTSPETAPLTFNGQFQVDTIPREAPETGNRLVTDPDTLVGTLSGSGLNGVRLLLGRTSAD